MLLDSDRSTKLGSSPDGGMFRANSTMDSFRFFRRAGRSLSEFWRNKSRSKCRDILGYVLERYCTGVWHRSLLLFRILPPFILEFGLVSGTFVCPFGLTPYGSCWDGGDINGTSHFDYKKSGIRAAQNRIDPYLLQRLTTVKRRWHVQRKLETEL